MCSFHNRRSASKMLSVLVLITLVIGNNAFAITNVKNPTDLTVGKSQEIPVYNQTQIKDDLTQVVNKNNNTLKFTLTNKISIENESISDVITTADGILTTKVDENVDGPVTVTRQEIKNKEMYTVVDNNTSSYSSLPVTPVIDTTTNNEQRTYNPPLIKEIIRDNDIDASNALTLRKEKSTEPPNNSNLITTTIDNKYTPRTEESTIEHKSSENIKTTIHYDLDNVSLDQEIDTQPNTFSQTTITNELKFDNNILQFQSETESKNDGLPNKINNVETQLVNADETGNRNVMKIQGSSAKLKEEESLTVQAITFGSKTKSPSALYTVKSSYKRPKKLEITQPKSYKRDPNDNSWRNESISSLGIVFKANNATKPFTLLLKNKTESELIATMQKFDSDGNNIPELKERLEKLSERRKTKKKRPDGDYRDAEYEDIAYPDITTINIPKLERPRQKLEPPRNKSRSDIVATATTELPKLVDFDEFDTMSDEEKIMPLMELKRTSTTTSKPRVVITSPSPVYQPDRKPTVQYFPPRGTSRELPAYITTSPSTEFPVSLPSIKSTAPREQYGYTHQQYTTTAPSTELSETPINPTATRESYKQEPPRNRNYYASTNDITQHFHYTPAPPKQFPVSLPPMNPTATKEKYEPSRNEDYYPRTDDIRQHLHHTITTPKEFPESPIERERYVYLQEPPKNIDYYPITPNDIKKDLHYQTYTTERPADMTSDVASPVRMNTESFDYDGKLYQPPRVKHFPEYRDRFTYPVLYNNSVIHTLGPGTVAASSSAFMKRLYDGERREEKEEREEGERAVELAADYELHYYVPDQEEKQEDDRIPYPLLDVNNIRPITFYDRDAI